MITRIQVVFYSMYGHIHKMARAVVDPMRCPRNSPKRMPSSLVRNFLDQTGPLWLNGGIETTITGFHTTLLHHGMVVVGVPYSQQKLLEMNSIEGGSPYGASTITRGDGTRQPSAHELEIARFQGMHVADIARRLTGAHWARG
jgi:multimeric flavodoxin WrbA